VLPVPAMPPQVAPQVTRPSVAPVTVAVNGCVVLTASAALAGWTPTVTGVAVVVTSSAWVRYGWGSSGS
jgi:hypothetical protein